jgi:hypothetical protein
MTSEKQAARSTESGTRRLGRLLLLELPAGQLLILAAAVGAFWAASLFDWGFVIGRDAFWEFPKGTIKASDYDMAEVLAAYFYYIQSSWHLPLFHISALGTPSGTNIILMDAVPVIALVGKLIRTVTGATPNLLGAYLFLCFVLPGVMMTLVLIAAKTRYALAAIVGAVFANTMPALLWQWGHIALEAHFLLIGALALYLCSLQKRIWGGLAGAWAAYLAVTYLTNIYLFAMIGIVWLCTVSQRHLNGLATTRGALGTGALIVALVTSLVALSGLFNSGSGLPFDRYGYYSMNLLSPFVPQESGLLPGLGGVIDATGGQYEGFNYLGLGLLLVTLLMLPTEADWLRRNLRQHVALVVALVGMTAFAVSNRVFASHWLLFEMSIPQINWMLGIFRSSGRFFWLVGYALIAFVVVLGFRGARPLTALCLVGAAILQLCDVQPLRAQIIASVAAGPSAEELDGTQIARLISGARHVEVVPSMQCSRNEDQARANIELMLATARANVPTNTVFLGRESFGVSLRDVLRAPARVDEMLLTSRTAYCEQEVEQAQRAERPGDVLVLLSDQPRQLELMSDIICSPLSWARYCEKKQ